MSTIDMVEYCKQHPSSPACRTIESVNESTTSQNSEFRLWIDKVIAEIRNRGYTVSFRLDTSGDGIFTTHTTAQVDGTKGGITARVLYTGIHLSLSAFSAANMMDRAWIVKKESVNLPLAPTPDPTVFDPIEHQSTFNYNPGLSFPTTTFGEPAVSLPPTNQPGKTDTTVPVTTGTPTQSTVQSPTDPDKGDAPEQRATTPMDPKQPGMETTGPLKDNTMIALGIFGAIIVLILIAN